MGELVTIAVALLLGGGCAFAVTRSLRPVVRGIVWASFAAHVIAAVFSVFLVYEVYDGVGDMETFVRLSAGYAEYVVAEPGLWLGQFVNMLAHRPAEIPFVPSGGAGSSRAMYALATLIQAAFGPSRYGINLLVAVASFAGKLPLMFALFEAFHARLHTRIAAATLLLPSLVFWTGGFNKEAVAVCGLGALFWGTWRILSKRSPVRGAVVAALGALPIAMVKAYILFAFVVAASLWFWFSRPQSRPQVQGLRAVQLVGRSLVAVAVAGALVVGLAEVFPRFALNNLVDEMATLQSYGSLGRGGSAIQIGPNSGSAVAQAASTPLALFTALYRPLLFDVRNPLMLVNALEATALLLLTFVVLRRRGFVGSVRAVSGSPVLVFFAAFTLIFAIAVGLSSTNLGTLSRYRAPMTPFFTCLLLILATRPRVPRSVYARRPHTPAHAGRTAWSAA